MDNYPLQKIDPSKISPRKRAAMGMVEQPKVDFSPKPVPTPFGGNTTDNDSGDSN